MGLLMGPLIGPLIGPLLGPFMGLLKGALMKESSNAGNILITVKDEESQEKTNISLPCFYDISSEVIENIKAVEGVFEIQAT